MDDLKLIKRHYGEKMMHLCRELFPTLLETEGLLFSIISSKFPYSKTIYDGVNNTYNYHTFKSIIFEAADKSDEIEEVNQTPEELLNEAGYTLYECKTEADIQRFRHYYYRSDGTPEYVEGEDPATYNGEELCTFNGGRLNRCHVFFAVKENADKLNRKDFKDPKREDEYGTSVISIQFAKGGTNTLSIKNRYNHTVDNPDATYSNNLENIIPGLTKAFEKTYNLKINQNANSSSLVDFVLANDGKYYRYNYEIDNIYYCPDNVIIDNFEVKHYDESRYLVFEHFILDMQEKTLSSYKQFDGLVFRLGNIKSIKITKNPEGKTIQINDDVEIQIDKYNQIRKYKDMGAKNVFDAFLSRVKNIEEVDMPNLEEIESCFLEMAQLRKISLPKVTHINSYFIDKSPYLEEIYLPNVEYISDNFLFNNKALKRIELPKLKKVGDCFLATNGDIEEVIIPELEEVDDSFLECNCDLKRLEAPKLRKVGHNFLQANETITEIVLPNLESTGKCFLSSACNIKSIDFPKLTAIGSRFMEYSKIKSFILPEVEKIKSDFMGQNGMIESFEMPKLKKAGPCFLESATLLKKVELPSLEATGYRFLHNSHLDELILPNLVNTLDIDDKITNLTAKHREIGTNYKEKPKGL